MYDESSLTRKATTDALLRLSQSPHRRAREPVHEVLSMS
jgi:hypothetical protein